MANFVDDFLNFGLNVIKLPLYFMFIFKMICCLCLDFLLAILENQQSVLRAAFMELQPGKSAVMIIVMMVMIEIITMITIVRIFATDQYNVDSSSSRP